MITSLGFWIKVAFFFLYRSARSAAILSLMILSAVCTLIFLSAMAVGINDAMIRNSVSLFSGHISGFHLPANLKKETLLVDGVTNVLMRAFVPGALSHGGHIQTVTLIAMEPSEEMKSTAIWKKTIQGKYPENGDRTIFLSQPLAEDLKVQAGDRVFFGSGPAMPQVSFTVSGIYRTGVDPLDRGIAFCPVDAIPIRPDTLSAGIFLKEGVDPESIIAAYRNLLPKTAQFKSWADMMPDLRQLIDSNYVSMSIVIVLVFGVVSLGISCAFVISILRNIREYGIMKAMGVTSRETALLIFSEVILMNLFASLIGVLAGILAVLIVNQTGIDLTAWTSHNRYFAVSGVIFPRLTPYSLCLPPLVALLFSLAAVVWPAWLIARKRAAEVMRIV